MKQLKIGTIPLPKLYICDSRADASKCRELGIPYLIKPKGWDDEKVVKAILWRTLAKRFPDINWNHVFGSIPGRNRLRIHVPHVVEHEAEAPEPVEPEYREVQAEPRSNPGTDTCGGSDAAMEYTENAEYRWTEGGLDPEDSLTFDEPEIEWEDQTIDRYIGDLGHFVNVEELQALRLLPTFLDDIANAIKLNLMNTAWCDGYNKKLGYNLGHWQGTDQAPNLIILDVSGSIPSGVAGTMISLIETLRHQANADLIITSGRSEYWPANAELPDPDKLSYLVGGCNEFKQFYAILRKHIFGKHWGNVIVFGDQDAPTDGRLRRYYRSDDDYDPLKNTELQHTRIDRILAFHTYAEEIPGYGLWAKNASPNAEVVYNREWVTNMNRY